MHKHQQHWCPVALIPVDGITSTTHPVNALTSTTHPTPERAMRHLSFSATSSLDRILRIVYADLAGPHAVGAAMPDVGLESDGHTARCVMHARRAHAPKISALAVSEGVFAFLELWQLALVGDQIHGARTFHGAFQLSLHIHTHARTTGESDCAHISARSVAAVHTARRACPQPRNGCGNTHAACSRGSEPYSRGAERRPVSWRRPSSCGAA